MTTRKDEIDGGRQTVPERPFMFGTADNFVITWANRTFGVQEGKPFSTTLSWDFMPKAAKLRWMTAEIMFLQQMLERLLRYADLLAAEPDDEDEEEEKEPEPAADQQ